MAVFACLFFYHFHNFYVLDAIAGRSHDVHCLFVLHAFLFPYCLTRGFLHFLEFQPNPSLFRHPIGSLSVDSVIDWQADIDQLMRIMAITGTPDKHLLAKLGSEEVNGRWLTISLFFDYSTYVSLTSITEIT